MRWSDERYIRAYTNDEGDYVVWSWQARALWWPLLRRCNRVGVVRISSRHRIKGLATMVMLPVEVVEAGLDGADGLIADGCVTEPQPGVLFVRNYMPAQEAKQSDAARKRAERERERDRLEAIGFGIDANELVTKTDTASAWRTKSHEVSQPVTLSLAEPFSVPSEQGEPASVPPTTAPLTLISADPDPSLPFRARAAVDAVETSSQGRFRAPKKIKAGHAITVERCIRQYPKIEQWTELGRWILAGGVSRPVVDIGALATKCDEWFPFVASWCRDGRKPITPTSNRPGSTQAAAGPTRYVPDVAPVRHEHTGPESVEERRKAREAAQRAAKESA